MREEKTREKIVKVMVERFGIMPENCAALYSYQGIADALIEANIGDVTEWKERAGKHRVIALPGGRIKQLYSDEEVEQIVKERDELKERAGSEIKSCYKEIAQKRDEIAKFRKQLKCAQNAAKKQKHRAEVAERALSWLCDETMRDIRIIMYPTIGKQVRDKQELYAFCIEQAEREIEEYVKSKEE